MAGCHNTTEWAVHCSQRCTQDEQDAAFPTPSLSAHKSSPRALRRRRGGANDAACSAIPGLTTGGRVTAAFIGFRPALPSDRCLTGFVSRYPGIYVTTTVPRGPVRPHRSTTISLTRPITTTTMPAITTGLVLVTGASGFVGTHCVAALLDAGFRVRIAARSEEKAAHVRSLFPQHKDKIEHAVVKDIDEPTAYDAAVVGVDGILNLASPVTMSHVGDPNEVIGPAVRGITNLLNSIKAHNSTLKRFVQMSSGAAMGDFTAAPGTVWDESHWNDPAIERCDTLKDKVPGPDKYSASKARAERAFWKFIADTKPSWDAVALQPVFCFGPPTQFAPKERPSSLFLFNSFLKPNAPAQLLSYPFGSMVDVRDVAKVSVLAFTTPEASGTSPGERYILAADTLWGNDLALGVERVAPGPGYLAASSDVEWRKSLDEKIVKFDGRKAERVFGFTYMPKDESIKSTAEAIFKAREGEEQK
ncbi:Putative uncharacterized oxidoreductase [Vanrija pseudolonga]|uniref:Uncharacterized oxidoreductase n=1 Tax=Vanrija pseudolonga TaxID=143232 RepID=A0AAF0Y913_9TREE|nr:Putative uncharacterized oxidoreductase [Vanrija pseudolonga]